MTRNSNVRVIGDFESFLDSLLAHTEEENCTHSVSDFLQEYFEKKNKIVVGTVEGSNNQQQTKPPHSGATGGLNG